MDYTTLALVKSAIGAQSTGKDTLLTALVTVVSRAIDRKCTGAVTADTENYFQQATVANEVSRWPVYQNAELRIFPHKPLVTAVSALSYRETPREDWVAVDSVSYLEIEQARVTYWGSGLPDSVQVKISYTGGLATSQSGLPGDLVEAATVLAARYFREELTGLTDAIGVDELGLLVYTKAMPARVRDMLAPFMRVVPW